MALLRGKLPGTPFRGWRALYGEMYRLKLQFPNVDSLNNFSLMRPVFTDNGGKLYYGHTLRNEPADEIVETFALKKALYTRVYSELHEEAPNFYTITDEIKDSFKDDDDGTRGRIEDFLAQISTTEQLRSALFPRPFGRFAGVSLPSQPTRQPFRNIGLVDLRVQYRGVCDVAVYLSEWEQPVAGDPFCWPPLRTDPASSRVRGMVMDIVQEPSGIYPGRLRVLLT